ncbi:large subunit of alpha-aminoadipate reductase [Coemansia sp. RSA 2050]|nr:large subunit of alpha-aminoadipate reductase [Coemansia sp. RSA 2050]KAJ2729893.1 large subunit of alpha-aminoadipate reductase [Coemansia sp. BCRC 34962]
MSLNSVMTPVASTADLAEVNSRVSRWQDRLRSPTELQLPTDYPRPIPLKVVEAMETFELSAASSLSVLQLSLHLQQQHAADNTASPFTVLLAAFAVLLHRYTAEEDIVVGSSSESLNPLVLRLAVRAEDSFLDVLQMAQQVSREAAADEVPFAALMSAYRADGGEADASAAPSLFRVRFFNQTDADEATLRRTTTQTTDFTVLVRQRSTGSLRQLHPTIELQIVYNQVLFTAQRMAHMVAQLQMVLAAAGETLGRAQAGRHVPAELQVGRMSIASALDLAAVPDPRAGLAWGEFPGSITSIFARGALAFPERRFVVESVLRGGVPVARAFTYGQMLRAARVLSRALRDGGVAREDVVVVYAYRGVDLVVAILGVLMAGATYSVVDPAYPAARQNVYLGVAQPRGLVVLEHAGALADEVQAYVDSELHVVCTVAGMELRDDGELVGAGDAVARATRAVDAAEAGDDDVVEVGPDSVGTLSFTSGSTGIPKGVRGRHFSLTHFYPWMGAEFGLGPSARFTMLSGIAHDPIQRDVFTPVFFGAELHIPTAEDIGVPGQLAQWMADHEITVTHLTPAMGQLLSANATSQIPSLRNAFFVGDLLTKRDCHRLQSLAANCRIVNMYGTTETQRAVSYCAIPPHAVNASFLATAKDVIPAGRGMKDVQLLVVNRHGSGGMCAVGEVGEIYVRSGGLAEGYLRLPEATAEKFVDNWLAPAPLAAAEPSDLPYYKGARDRMYRTGDLGRYRADGDVECIGRIDDQVKIRGFRIELGEINNMLSMHPRIRANVTLVRRDKYEEKTLVAYIVPSEEEQRTEDPGRQLLIASVREYLRQKLPAYAVPSVFVPLRRLPLTPNGKVDKAALPFPDTPAPPLLQQAAGGSPTERALAAVWADVLGLGHPPAPESNFFDVGGHSVAATRMVFRVRTDFAVDAPLGLVFRCPVLRDMAAAIDALRGELQLTETPAVEAEETSEYAADLAELIAMLPEPPTEIPSAAVPEDATYLLTGATGFLGAFVLDSLLRRHPRASVVCLVRAADSAAAMQRVRQAAVANLVWTDEWAHRVSAVTGDLAQPRLGLSEEDWGLCAGSVDVIVHNGALVHWVYPYARLRAANVLSTLEAVKLATEGRLKRLVFVSSTSALDTDHYVQLGCVGESDDLEGSRTGLMSGYGQSKWVAERLLMHARHCGWPVAIVRPGYVLGDSRSGATNADDFLWRLAKGCAQLQLSPVMANPVNVCPVDYVADVVTFAASQASALDHMVYHVFNRGGFRFHDIFDLMRAYGYPMVDAEYMRWRSVLMESTLDDRDSALYPLLHFVLDDLPTSTKSPDLDDKHTRGLLEGSGIVCPDIKDLFGLYLAYLVEAGFLDRPSGPATRTLPTLDVEVQGLVTRTSNN